MITDGRHTNQNQNEKPFYTHSVYISQKFGGPWWTVDRNLPAKAEDIDLIPGLGRFHMAWSHQACIPPH